VFLDKIDDKLYVKRMMFCFLGVTEPGDVAELVGDFADDEARRVAAGASSESSRRRRLGRRAGRATADKVDPGASRWADVRARAARLGRQTGHRAAQARARLLAMRRRLNSTRRGRIGVKIAVAFVGAVVIALGVVLLPLPGPGWVIILTGMAILSMEFRWARKLLRFTRDQLQRWARLVRQGHWLVRMTSVLLTLGVIGGALWLSYTLFK
jgi:uncharacterized protein (TIGR02611 family)